MILLVHGEISLIIKPLITCAAGIRLLVRVAHLVALEVMCVPEGFVALLALEGLLLAAALV